MAGSGLNVAPAPAAVAVLGVIGPDVPESRAALREWAGAVTPLVLVRFAVSLRDRAGEAWWRGAAQPAEADVDFLDCLGQGSGPGVVIFSLFDAWLRHAVARYPQARFIGRADSDTVPSPSWLLSFINEQSNRFESTHLYAGTLQWYCWDTIKYRPWGWALGPHGSRRAAMRENPEHCAPKTSNPRCSGPFPFAAGPLLLLSSTLARWYAHSAEVSSAVVQGLTARLNLTADESSRGSGGSGGRTGGSGASASAAPAGSTLSVDEARARGIFLQPADAGDLDLRLWDDIFLGHALCMGGASNVSLLELPPGLVADVPCNGGVSGCHNGIRRFNFSVQGTPLVFHRVKKRQFVGLALSYVRTSVYMPPAAERCRPLGVAMDVQRKGVPLACGADWELCRVPFGAPAKAFVNRPKAGASRGKAAKPLRNP